MRRLFVAGLVLVGATAVAIGSVRASDDPPVDTNAKTVGQNFVDADGDGVCDNCSGTTRGQGRGQGGQKGQQAQKGRQGQGGQGMGPRDGSGNGKGPGAGCDGTGPKGSRRGGRGGGRR
jgi:hypothetical protein